MCAVSRCTRCRCGISVLIAFAGTGKLVPHSSEELHDTNMSTLVIHAEMPVHAPGQPDPRGLQLWVDLPSKFKMVSTSTPPQSPPKFLLTNTLLHQIEPSYQELGPNEIPTAYPEGPDGPVKVKVISGKSHGVESPVRPLGGCWYFHYIFDKKATVFQDLRACFDFHILRFALTFGSCSRGMDCVHLSYVVSSFPNR